uniref:Uncharacterized protein n=1 Tax=Rhizophora mucronata TaxID=61149 RepID=A0A2P2QY64_RHIMU
MPMITFSSSNLAFFLRISYSRPYSL